MWCLASGICGYRRSIVGNIIFTSDGLHHMSSLTDVHSQSSLRGLKLVEACLWRELDNSNLNRPHRRMEAAVVSAKDGGAGVAGSGRCMCVRLLHVYRGQ